MEYDYTPTSFLGKCGNDCGNCPLHKNNLLTMEDKIKTSKGCGVYINWNPSCSSLKKLSFVNLTDSTKRAYKNTSRC